MAICRVVAKESHRGKGISKIMLNKAIDFIINDLNQNKIWLSGQPHLADHYQNWGFKKVSDIYLEDGIGHFEFLYEI